MGVVYMSPRRDEFEDLYIGVRRKEHRVFTDAQLARLPHLIHHPLETEWKLRKKSAQRFVEYLKKKNKPLEILEIGCGNGWFSNFMADVPGTQVTGLDINSTELEQAAAVFDRPNLHFVYADLFEANSIHNQKFDLIVFNSCFQYFADVPELLAIACKMLRGNGEIHIMDTPFYTIDQIQDAQNRTRSYYSDLGFPEMAARYFHHSWSELPDYEIRYRPSLFSKLLHDSPFCWIAIKKR